VTVPSADPPAAPQPAESVVPASVRPVLQNAVEEAARLLATDGAFLYLLDPASGRLRFTSEAGIHELAGLDWVRQLELPVGMGMFGKAAEERRVVVTGDYAADRSFRHFPGPDRLVTELGIRSLVAAPIVAGDELFGSLGTFSREQDAFNAPQIALVRALAEHAGFAIANARLIEELDQSRARLRRQAEVERSLRELGTRISAARDPAEVVQGTIDEALRVLGGDGARIDLLDPDANALRGVYSAGQEQIRREEWPEDPDDRVDVGVSGMAFTSGRTFWTADYLADDRLRHSSGPDTYVRAKEIRSVIATPLFGEQGPFGTLSVWSTRADAFSEWAAGILEAIAGQSAVALSRARLIEELGHSREALARRAEEERTLRELGARLSELGDPTAVLQRIVDEAARLLGAERARLDLVEPTSGRRLWSFPLGRYEADQQVLLATERGDRPRGMAAFAIAAGRTVVTPDYLADDRFEHYAEGDDAAREADLRSVAASPLFGEAGLLGVMQLGSRRLDAFGEEQVRVIETFAAQAAIAVTNARLVDRLGTSQTQLARTAEAERSLREIAARITAIRDPLDLLRDLAAEACRLLDSTAAIIDLIDPETGESRFWHDVGVPEGRRQEWLDRGLGDPAASLAVAARTVVTTADYAADPRFDAAEHTAFLHEIGVRALAVAPLVRDGAVLGTLTVISDRTGKYDDADAALLAGLGDQAAIAVGNARLVEELGRSREALASKAEAEHALREIAGRMMAIRDPAVLLQGVVDEAARLLGSTGAVIDLLDPATGQVDWAHDAGVAPGIRDEWKRRAVGLDGVRLSIAGRSVVTSPDYASDSRFADAGPNAAFCREAGIRSVAIAPLVGEAVVLGTLAVFSGEVGAFGEDESDLLAGLADLATIAIRNAELIRELARSREESARRADTERTLREIAARITAIRDPEAILGLIVDEARRILGSDGAHLTRLSGDERVLRPVVVSGGMDDEARAWLRRQEFPVGGGINGLAAAQGRAVWTPNYATDPRIPREPDDLQVADRMGISAMAAAPLRAPGGEVIGTLAVSYRTPGPLAADRLATLQSLADHAAIAVSNSDLYQRLESSEENYRRIVQTSPDAIWRADAEGMFTFVGEAGEALFGRPIEDMVGRPYMKVVAPESRADAAAAYASLADPASTVDRFRFVLTKGDGSTFPAEVSAVGVFEDGRFAGGQGTVRDVSERERLERELRESEERYRFLVQNSPDIVFSADAETRFTFLSESITRLTGFEEAELVGQPFAAVVTDATLPVALERWQTVVDDPSQAQVLRLALRHKDGGSVPVEIHSVGAVGADGEFAGIHGSARDIGERERLERELRESEERYRSVIQSTPDLIWATNPLGHFVFVSDRVRDLLGWSPEEVIGRPFREFIGEASIEAANREWERLAQEPGRTQTQRLDLHHRDGSLRPFEVSSVAVVHDGEVQNVYGIARDVGERERLERELRESEERYRYLVQSSPDLVWVTDDEGRFTFMSDQARTILGWEPEELIGRSFTDLSPAEAHRSGIARWKLLRRRPTSIQRSRFTVLSRDGRELAMEVTGIGMMEDGRFIGAHGAARDVSARDRLDRDLRRQAAELASSEERSHLARELHDSVTQALFSMTLLSRSIELMLERDPAQVPAMLASLRELQRDALAEMRALIFELRPGNIEESGLVAALRTHVASLSGRIGLPVVVEADLPDRLPLEIEEALYRIAQEALHNVVKHAGAREVRVKVGLAGEMVHLGITDDGRGFDSALVPDGHLGLAGMRARAERLGGTLHVVSRPGGGTSIDVVVPPRVVPARSLDK
jgi:PAS domain S-box-containing protein